MARGVHWFFTQMEAALPTTSPIMPPVFITRTVPSASCVTLMSRPAMKRFSTFRE